MNKKETPIDWLVKKINEDHPNSTFIRPDVHHEAKVMFDEAIANAHLDGFKEATKEYTELFNFTLKPQQ